MVVFIFDVLLKILVDSQVWVMEIFFSLFVDIQLVGVVNLFVLEVL